MEVLFANFFATIGGLLISAIALLDLLPSYVRALLTAALLVWTLRHFEAKIEPSQVQLGSLFRKTALIALVLVPLAVWAFPGNRLAVFVDVLPSGRATLDWLWQTLLMIWAAGVLVTLGLQVRNFQKVRSELAETTPLTEGDVASERIAQWRRRLGVLSDVEVRLGRDQRVWQMPGVACVVVPAAALHWPQGSLDLLLIGQLCHRKRGHGRWQVVAALVRCLYWPVPWLAELHANLNAGFDVVADELARACYRDDLGYQRLARQIEQRSATPAPEVAARRPYVQHFVDLAELRLLLEWRPNTGSGRKREEAEADRDRYDKVFWFVGQAVFVALLCTTVTLERTPPEFDSENELPFDFVWRETMHRDLERKDQQYLPLAEPAGS